MALPLSAGGTRTVALVFAVVGVVLVLVTAGADDEGYLAYIGARVIGEAPIAGLFFQKIHPTLSLFYAPVAVLGWTAYRLAHVIVAALGIFFLGDAVERLGGEGKVAAALLALSPAFLLAAIAGQSNTDGVAFFAAVLSLHARGGRAALFGAALAGFALWTRYEMAPMLGAVVLFGLFDPQGRWARLAAAATFPTLYLTAGAVYHGDALWFVHFTPNVTAPVPSNPVYRFLEADLAGVMTWLWHVTLAAPAWPALFLVRWKKLPLAGRTLLVALALQAAAMFVLPLLNMFFEGLGPRYMLVLAPAVAVVLALGPLAVARTGRAVIGLALALTLLSPLASGDVLGRLGVVSSESAELLREVELLHEPGGTVYTNDPRLSVLLSGSGVPARFIPQHDVLFELHHLANHDNGQYERILRALEDHLYGGAAWPCGFRDLDTRDRFVLVHDDRLHVLYPAEYWEPHTELVRDLPHAAVRRPKPAVDRIPPPTPPPGIDAHVIGGPCGQERRRPVSLNVSRETRDERFREDRCAHCAARASRYTRSTSYTPSMRWMLRMRFLSLLTSLTVNWKTLTARPSDEVRQLASVMLTPLSVKALETLARMPGRSAVTTRMETGSWTLALPLQPTSTRRSGSSSMAF